MLSKYEEYLKYTRENHLSVWTIFNNPKNDVEIMKAVLLNFSQNMHIETLSQLVLENECLEPYLNEQNLIKIFIYNDNIKRYKYYFNKYGFYHKDFQLALHYESPKISKLLYYYIKDNIEIIIPGGYPQTRHIEFHKFVYDEEIYPIQTIFNAAVQIRSIELLEYIKPRLTNQLIIDCYDSDWSTNDDDTQTLEWLVINNMANFRKNPLFIYRCFHRMTNSIVLNYFGQENCYTRGELVHVGVKREFISDKKYLAELDLLYSKITPILAEIFWIRPIREIIQSYAFC